MYVGLDVYVMAWSGKRSNKPRHCDTERMCLVQLDRLGLSVTAKNALFRLKCHRQFPQNVKRTSYPSLHGV